MNKNCLLACCFAWCLNGFAVAAESCRVLDPELAGGYVGACKDGLAEGFGIAQGSAVYQGEFSAGKKHGRGRKTWSGGDSYEGQFVDDRRQGEGIYRWGPGSPWAGDYYWGGYRQDKRHGFGRYVWANGDKYEGEWKDDLRYGFSAMEVQRQRARDAWLKGVGGRDGIGAVVCASMPVGIAHQVDVRGEVTEIAEEAVSVLLQWVQADPVLPVGGAVQVGQRVKRPFYDWRPCVATH